jgi:TRAP-type C4-dicarboxylate transport system permease small subunit
MNATTPFMNTAKKTLALTDKILLILVKGICILCFVGLFVLALANVFIRLVPIFSLHFFDEVQQWLLGAMIFWGSAGLWMLRDHLKVDDVARFLFGKSRVARALINLIIELASLFFICVFINACFFLSTTLMGETNYLRVPEKIIYLTAMLLPGVIMVVYSFRNIAVCVWNLVRAFKRKPDVTLPPDQTAVPPDQTVVSPDQTVVSPDQTAVPPA